MEANHPNLTPQKSFYMETSRARHRAELATDDGKALAEHLQAATGKRITALESLETTRSKAQPPERDAVSEATPGFEKPWERMPDSTKNVIKSPLVPELELQEHWFGPQIFETTR